MVWARGLYPFGDIIHFQMFVGHFGYDPIMVRGMELVGWDLKNKCPMLLVNTDVVPLTLIRRLAWEHRKPDLFTFSDLEFIDQKVKELLKLHNECNKRHNRANTPNSKQIDLIQKFNPNHGSDGRFAPGGSSESGSDANISHDFEQALADLNSHEVPEDISVRFLDDGDDQNIKDWCKRNLGTDDMNTIAAVFGVPSESNVIMTFDADSSAGGEIKMFYDNRPLGIYAERRLSFDKQQNGLVLYNEMFYVGDNRRGHGVGTKCLARQVEFASQHGVSVIKTEAVKSSHENGYYTWPRLGYDAPIRNRKGLPDFLKDAVSISDIMQTEKGRNWWKENGDTVDCVFDLSNNSRSRKILDAYVRHRFGYQKYCYLITKGKKPKKPMKPKQAKIEQAPLLNSEEEELLDSIWSNIEFA